MRWFRFAFLIIAAAVIQSSALLGTISLTDMHIKPDLLLMLLVYFAISCESYDAIICSFAIGFAADLTGAAIGPHFISFGLLGTVLAHIKKVILLKQTRQQAAAIFVMGILTYILASMLIKFKVPSAAASMFKIFTVSIYSAILWFLVKWLVKAMGKWVGAGVFRFGAKPQER